jgi:hypothetical protein
VEIEKVKFAKHDCNDSGFLVQAGQVVVVLLLLRLVQLLQLLQLPLRDLLPFGVVRRQALKNGEKPLRDLQKSENPLLFVRSNFRNATIGVKKHTKTPGG